MPHDRSGLILASLRKAFPPPDWAALTDGDLLRRFTCDGDMLAFEALVRRHAGLVWGVCRRMLRDHQGAEDAFQATLLALVRHAGSIRAELSLAGWLYQVAYRTASAARVAALRRQGREVPLWSVAAAAKESFVDGEVRGVLDEEISRLPEKYRRPLLLCYMAGHTTAEAARLLNCPRGTVLTRLAWARQRLRVRLLQRGISLSLGSLGLFLTSEACALSAPAQLASRAIRNVISVATQGAAVPAEVSALVQGGLMVMISSRLRTSMLLALAIGLAGVGWLGVAARETTEAQIASDGARAVSPEKVHSDVQPRPIHELLRRLRDRSRRLPTVATMGLSISCQQGSETVGLNGQFTCMRPHHFRCKTYVAGEVVVDIGSNAEGFWYWFKKGTNPEPVLVAYADLVRERRQSPWLVLPDALFDLLGMSEIQESDLAEAVTEIDKSDARWAIGCLYLRPDADGNARALGFVDDEFGVRISSVALVDASKTIRWRVTVDDWKPVGQDLPVVPTSLCFRWPDQKLEVRIKAHDPRLPGPLSADRQQVLFSPPKVLEADSASKSRQRFDAKDSKLELLVAKDRTEVRYRGEAVTVYHRPDAESLSLLRRRFDRWVGSAKGAAPTARIVVEGDTKYAQVVSVLDALKHSGIREIVVEVPSPQRP